MASFLLLKAMITFVTLLGLCLSVYGVLKVADWLLGKRFKQFFAVVEREPVALAVYFGLRLVAVFMSCSVVLCLAFLF